VHGGCHGGVPVSPRLELTPPTGSGSAFGLEAWLLGTPGELDAATAALAGTGAVVWQGANGVRGGREPLTGADRGRHRTYLRVLIGGAAQ
jgi:hypothetical protein